MSGVELRDLVTLFHVEPIFDGPADRCPACTGEIDQLALWLEMEGELTTCGACGAVLAA